MNPNAGTGGSSGVPFHTSSEPAAHSKEQEDAEIASRIAFMLSPVCSPLRELRWWVSRFGQADGLKKLTESLIEALYAHIRENGDDFSHVDRGREFLEMLCLWFEHIICADHLLMTLQDTATWQESTTICKQKIKSVTDGEPQRVCSRSFRAGDIVWNCKQCQMDSTCVLCQQCFRDSNHEGHDVYFYHVMTDGGGCCDCGDAGAWNPKGFCTRHGEASVQNQNPDPRKWQPPEIATNAKFIIEQVVQCMAKLAAAGRAELVLEPLHAKFESAEVLHSEAFCDEVKRLYDYISTAAHYHLRPRETRDEMAVPILLKSWFVKVERCIRACTDTTKVADALENEVGQFVLSAITIQNIGKCMKMVSDTRTLLHFKLTAKHASSIQIALYTEHLATWLLQVLCVDSDAFSRITCHALTEDTDSTYIEKIPIEADDRDFLAMRRNSKNEKGAPKIETNGAPSAAINTKDDGTCREPQTTPGTEGTTSGPSVEQKTVDASKSPTPNVKGLDCTLEPLKTLIVRDLQMPESCSRALRNLYIRLLVDSLFKQRFAVAFAQTYRVCARARVNRLPVLEMSDQDSICSLSVQFLNRPNHVQLLVNEHGFLRSILHSLITTVKSCEQVDPASEKLQLDLLSTVLTHRKTKCLVTDLQYVLNTPGMSSSLLADDPVCLEMWFALLDTVYGMHEQKRIVHPDLPEKDDKWIPAFNLSLPLLTLFSDLTRYLMFGEAIQGESLEATSEGNGNMTTSPQKLERQKNHGAWCQQMLSFCTEQVSSILAQKGYAMTYVESLFGQHPYIEHHVASEPVTFHCLLQRFYACVQALAISSTLEQKDYEPLTKVGSTSFWIALLRQPVNALVLFAQSNANMWNRNEDILSQAMNYQSLPFVSGMFMDIRTVQMAALTLEPDTIVNYLVYAHDLIDWLGLAKDSAKQQQDQNQNQGQDQDQDRETASPHSPSLFRSADARDEHERLLYGRTFTQSDKVAATMLELLCIVVTELPHTTPFALMGKFKTDDLSDKRIVASSDEYLRREIVHALAIKRSTFSMINDNCTHLKQVGVQVNVSNIHKVLSEVAQEIKRTDGMGPIQYELKPAVWSEFDPLFHRLARTEKDQARERWLQNRVAAPVDKACFPGDTKPKSSATRNEPLPATTWHANIHPAFHIVRAKLLMCNSTLLLIRKVLIKVSQEKIEGDCSPPPQRSSSLQDPGAPEVSDSPSPTPTRSSSFSVMLVANTLQLLTLQVHYLRSKLGPNYHNDGAVKDTGAAEPKTVSESALSTEVGAAQKTNTQGDTSTPMESQPSGVDSPKHSAENVNTIGSRSWFVSRILSKDRAQKCSVLDCLLAFWYNEPRIDNTNRENVRWILAELCKMDARILTKVRKMFKTKRSAIAAEKDKMSRKRKAQRHAMNAILQSQEQAFRAFAKEMEMDQTNEEDSGGFSLQGSQGQASTLGANVGSLQEAPPKVLLSVSMEESNFKPHDENDTKKTKLEGEYDGEAQDFGTSNTEWDGESNSLGSYTTGNGASQRKGDLGQRRTRYSSQMEQNPHRPSNLSMGEMGSFRGEIQMLEQQREVFGGAGAERDEMGNIIPIWKQQANIARQVWRGPECVSCHERHRLDDGPTCYIGFSQNNDALVREKTETSKLGWCVYWPQEQGRNFTIQLCGHAIHHKCLERYKSSVRAMSINSIDSNLDKSEFLCPLCKTISNVEVPCIPPSLVYTPRDLETDKTSSNSGQGSTGAMPHGDGQFADLAGPITGLDEISNWFSCYITLNATAHRKGWGQGFSPSSRDGASPSSNTAMPNVDGVESTTSETIHFFSRHLEPLAETLRVVGTKKERSVPFVPKFNFHSEQGRLREMQTMVLLERGDTPHHEFYEDPVSIVFSVALTFIAEHQAAAFGKVQATTMSVKVVKRLKHLFESCRAFLIVGNGSALNHLQSLMYELFSDKRSIGHHCVLRHSPEMLLLLSVCKDCSLTNVMASIRSMYILKLVQTLLELAPEDVDAAGAFSTRPVSSATPRSRRPSVGSELLFGMDENDDLSHQASGTHHGHMMGEEEEYTGIFQGALDFREALLDKLQGFEIQSRLPPGNQSEALSNVIIDSLLPFVHISQMALAVSQNMAQHKELKLVPREKVTSFMETELHLPTPSRVLQHEGLMHLISDWIDQALVCMPNWIPRSQANPVRDISEMDTKGVSLRLELQRDLELQGPRPGPVTANRRGLVKVRPLTLRPLVSLRNSYTEQYVEVHQGVCGECKEPAHDRAICLICGEILLAGKKHPKGPPRSAGEIGECTRHTKDYHGGIGIVLLFRRSSSVLLIHGSYSAYFGSLYADENGDDQQVIPSLPMFLDRQRYMRVHKLWAESAVPSQVASLRNSASVVIRRNYY